MNEMDEIEARYYAIEAELRELLRQQAELNSSLRLWRGIRTAILCEAAAALLVIIAAKLCGC
jgi:hypothetical protein